MVKIILASLFIMNASATWARNYTTTFPLTENPLSENGNWINAFPMRTSGGVAYGTQTGLETHPPYNDAAAVLAGQWGPDQSVTAIIHSINQQGGNVYEEVELNVRMIITATTIAGYDVDFKCAHEGFSYVEIGYWNGTHGDILKNEGTLFKQISGPGVYNGDTIKVTAIGDVISVYQNGKQLMSITDNNPNHPKTGSPGIGCYQQGASGVNSDFGLSRFTATDNEPVSIQNNNRKPVQQNKVKQKSYFSINAQGIYSVTYQLHNSTERVNLLGKKGKSSGIK